MKDGTDREPWYVAPCVILLLPVIVTIAGMVALKRMICVAVEELREWAKGAD